METYKDNKLDPIEIPTSTFKIGFPKKKVKLNS